MRGLRCFLIVFGLLIPAAASAQSFSPSYDCRRVTDPVEVLVCNDRELAAWDRELSAIYYDYIRGLSYEEAEQLRKGEESWVVDRNTRCRMGPQLVDRACVETMYRGRKTALQSLASLSFVPGAWSKEGLRWVQLSSRSSAEEAILVAQSLQRKVPQYQPYLVLMALNGWYAVVSGPYDKFDARRVLEAITNSDAVIAAEGPYVTKGHRYALRMFHSPDELPGSVERPSGIPRSTPVSMSRNPAPDRRCSSAEIQKKQAVCYVVLAGEMACQSFLEKHSKADEVLTSAATSAACSAAASGLQSGAIDAEALVGAAFRGAVSGVGTKMMHADNDLFTRIAGAFLKYGVVTYDASQAIECARQVERQCM